MTILKVAVAEAETADKNKLLFPRAVFEAQIKRLKETIEGRGFMGELGRGTDSIVHMALVSHLVRDLWLDGNTLMAEIEVLNTPAGKTLQHLLNAGVKVEFKITGVGGVDVVDGGQVVRESYKLIQIYADSGDQ